MLADMGEGRREFIEHRVVCGRNTVPCEEVFRERLGAFQLRCGGAGPKTTQSCVLESIDDTGDEWAFRPDHGEVNGAIASERKQCIDVIHSNRDVA